MKFKQEEATDMAANKTHAWQTAQIHINFATLQQYRMQNVHVLYRKYCSRAKGSS